MIRFDEDVFHEPSKGATFASNADNSDWVAQPDVLSIANERL